MDEKYTNKTVSQKMSFEVTVEYKYEPQTVLWAYFPEDADWSPDAQQYQINGCRIKEITFGPRTDPPKKGVFSIFLKEKKDIQKFENNQSYKIERIG
ncbi:MAG: hypothetical protein ACSHYA_20085 [Opitutaceae bacterium]